MTETGYTIVEPSVELIPPPNGDNYLEFLEKCTRVCYKSEGLIKPGSAEKLMTKVVKEYEHLSVTEHANGIFKVHGSWGEIYYARQELQDASPLIRMSMVRTSCETGYLYVSGNVRMWKDFLSNQWGTSSFAAIMQKLLHKKWPFFFEDHNKKYDKDNLNGVKIIDENPFTNKDKLSVEEMKQHMTVTFKFIGDRSMSHQLVRHRLFAFSQESQRYCNYGKKGFQFVIPPTMTDEELALPFNNTTSLKKEFIEGALDAYQNYRNLLAAKVPPEDARGLLPNCTKTEVVVTGTLGYLLDHTIPHRGHNPKAQWQIRELFLDVEKILKKELTLA